MDLKIISILLAIFLCFSNLPISYQEDNFDFNNLKNPDIEQNNFESKIIFRSLVEKISISNDEKKSGNSFIHIILNENLKISTFDNFSTVIFKPDTILTSTLSNILEIKRKNNFDFTKSENKITLGSLLSSTSIVNNQFNLLKFSNK